MSSSAGLWHRFSAAVVGVVLALTSVQALALSAAEARGKQIYMRGTSSSGSTINALVGREGVALPASAVPCASCHGPDGHWSMRPL